MSAALRQCSCGAPLPPDEGAGPVLCRACGKMASASAAAIHAVPPIAAEPGSSGGSSTPPHAPKPISAKHAAQAYHMGTPPPKTHPAEAAGIASAPTAEGNQRVSPPAARLVGPPVPKGHHPIKFECGCGQVLLSRRIPGAQVMCPACGQVLEVPAHPRAAEGEAAEDLHKPKLVLCFPCPCGDKLRTEEGVGSSVMCLNCGREILAPADAQRSIQFRCVCEALLESDESGGSEIACPACGKHMPVPHIEG